MFSLQFGYSQRYSVSTLAFGKGSLKILGLTVKLAVSMQLYYCSLILVHLQRPMSGGLEDHLKRRKLLRDCTRMVCGIAKTLTDYASSVLSSQCLFIGMQKPKVNLANITTYPIC